MSAIRAERDYVIHEDFMKVSLLLCSKLYSNSVEQPIVMFSVLDEVAASSLCPLIPIGISIIFCYDANSNCNRGPCSLGNLRALIYPLFHLCILSQAVRKLNEAKKLESSAHYSADFGKD